jgi:hypothetical protein
LERCLRDWRTAINVSKNTAVFFVKAVRRIQKPGPVQFLGDPIEWIETARYLGVNPDAQLTWSAHVNQVGKKVAQGSDVLGHLRNKRIGLSIRNGVLLCKQLIRPELRVSDLEI